MMRTQALATGIVLAGMALAGVAFLGAVAVPAENSASAAATAQPSTFDQHSAWQTWKLYCDTCGLE